MISGLLKQEKDFLTSLIAAFISLFDGALIFLNQYLFNIARESFQLIWYGNDEGDIGDAFFSIWHRSSEGNIGDSFSHSQADRAYQL